MPKQDSDKKTLESATEMKIKNEVLGVSTEPMIDLQAEETKIVLCCSSSCGNTGGSATVESEEEIKL